jgi:hypothetical protein
VQISLSCDRCKKDTDSRMPVKLGEPLSASVKLLICGECWESWATLLDRQESERSDFLLNRGCWANESQKC